MLNHTISLNKSKNRLFVTNRDTDRVSIFNLNSEKIDKTISVGNGPTKLAFNTKTSKLYVLNRAENTISVIGDTLATPTPSPTISPTPSPSPSP